MLSASTGALALLYHVNCDLLKEVSLALGKGRLHEKGGTRLSSNASELG